MIRGRVRFGSSDILPYVTLASMKLIPAMVNRDIVLSQGRPVHANVRASNEGLLRPRVARAQGIAKPFFLSFSSLYSSSPVLEGVGRWFSTARIEGPQFYHGASASKEDRLATPRSLIRSGSGRYQRVFDAPDLDLSSVFFRLRQVVGGLHSKPCLGAATECFL